jgi:hypothetical protein
LSAEAGVAANAIVRILVRAALAGPDCFLWVFGNGSLTA